MKRFGRVQSVKSVNLNLPFNFLQVIHKYHPSYIYEGEGNTYSLAGINICCLIQTLNVWVKRFIKVHIWVCCTRITGQFAVQQRLPCRSPPIAAFKKTLNGAWLRYISHIWAKQLCLSIIIMIFWITFSVYSIQLILLSKITNLP